MIVEAGGTYSYYWALKGFTKDKGERTKRCDSGLPSEDTESINK
jgi:hypothetical protein